MPVSSAGLLLWRRTGPSGLEVFVGHLGGPFWARKREGAWSIPKGEYDPADETPLDAATREFAEEIGVAAPLGGAPPADLGEFRYPSGKRLRVFAAEAPGFELGTLVSDTFDLEWPPRSGLVRSFPELDEARWMPLAEARPLVAAGQRPALDALLAFVDETDGG